MRGFVWVLLLLWMAACDAAPPPGASRPWDVEYRISGTATEVRVYYDNETGGSESRTVTRLPWQYDLAGRAGQFFFVSATISEGSDRSSIRCQLIFDGVEQESQEATGENGRVTCAGRFRD
jgi:hypothetical protein